MEAKPERAGHKREPEPDHVTTMHEKVEVFEDNPCACEPEPRWQRVGEENAELNNVERGTRNAEQGKK